MLLAVTSLVGWSGFGWPLFIHGSSAVNQAHSADAPWIFIAVLPLLLAVVLSELAEGSLDAKAIALLGILAACGAALRVPSPGWPDSNRSSSCSSPPAGCSDGASASSSAR